MYRGHPLIALMKDQVRNLRGRGIKAAAVYSGLSREEILVTLENCIFGNYKFLYVSPERLASDIFLAKGAPHAREFPYGGRGALHLPMGI